MPILQAAGCTIVEDWPENPRAGLSHVVVTSAAGEAKDLTSKLVLDHFDAILCIGGDGILHEVINGMANREDGSSALKRVAIGIIPAGMQFLVFFQLE